MVEFKDKEECKKIWQYLKENGIYVLPGGDNEFSGLSDQFIRFTIGEEGEMDKVVEVLYDYAKRCRRGDLNPHRHTPTTP